MGNYQSSPSEETATHQNQGSVENEQNEQTKILNPDQTKDDEESAEDYFQDCQESSEDDTGKDMALRETDETEEEEDEEEENNPIYTRLIRRPCCRCCLSRFPRTMAIIVGVVIPLFALILISLGFGYKLADYEAPSEFSANDEALANYYTADLQAEVVVNVTLILPRACFLLYLQTQEANVTELPPLRSILENELLQTYIENQGGIFGPDKDEVLPEQYQPNTQPSYDFSTELSNSTSDNTTWFEERYGHLFIPEEADINVTDLYNFMTECSLSAEDSVRELLGNAMTNVVEAATALSFNWIRCYEGAENADNGFRVRSLTPEQRSNLGQSEVYAKAWQEDRERLYNAYLQENLESGMSDFEAYQTAFRDSINSATGRSTCILNSAAAAWFYFTVQTTVGYGNQAPSSDEGRILIFTVGFATILCFGAVLAMSGYIVSFLFDEYVTTYNMKILSNPWIASIMWAVLYYVWMILIAVVTIGWKKDTLDIDIDLGEGYWFAYISTTTVGLGDIFLEPEGITGEDLFTFPAMFLVGFTLFAAFLSKFTELLNSIIQMGKTSFVETLLHKKVSWSEALSTKQIERHSSPNPPEIQSMDAQVHET